MVAWLTTHPVRSLGVAVLAVLIGAVAGCGSADESSSNAPESGTPDRSLEVSSTQPKPSTVVGDRLQEVVVPVPETPQEPSPFRFTDVKEAAGIDFVHFSGMTREKHFPTANGSGVAIFDYDGDGWMDLYFATATLLPLGTAETGPNRLYKNLGDGTFRDVTEESGLDFRGFCHGVIVGDINNNGHPDVFLATYRQNRLYRNNGDGTFTDITESAGLASPEGLGRVWVEGGASTAAASDAPIFIDATAVGEWTAGDGSGHDLGVALRPGQRLIFRQADLDAPHGLRVNDPKKVLKLGQKPEDQPEAVLQEVGPPGLSRSRLDQTVEPLAEGQEPVVIAEFVALREITESIPFRCTVHIPHWSSGGAFLDFDNDGYLDLYVSNYGDWEWPLDDRFCGDVEKNVRLYCSPKEVRTVRHVLYRNNGDETFTDVTIEAGVGRSDGHGFGVVTGDFDGDGLIDIYVANDMNPNFLFLNNGDGTFRDETEISGAALDDRGQANSGMGVDAMDVDGDGRPELFVTNFANEANILYRNLGNGFFLDETAFFGLAADAMPWVGWGCALADFDNDGWPDCFVTNGHVDDNRRELGQAVDYEERPLLFRNVAVGNSDAPDASRRFRLSTRDVGPYFDARHVGRGAAFGDLDNDGRLDIVVNHKDSPPAVLRNQTDTGQNWVRLVLVGTRSNRDAIGARVEVETSGGRVIHRQRTGGGSMLSSNDPRLLIGIGTADAASKVLVHWPSGALSVLDNISAGATVEVVEPTEDAS